MNSVGDDLGEGRDGLAMCPSCGAAAMSSFYWMGNAPVHSCLLMPSREVALAFPKAEIELGFCDSCGFISNLRFEPDKLAYSVSYEETQGFSPCYRTFAHDLASSLIDRYGLRGKDIVEIGCGKGEFLALLCELGGNRGIGIDPSYVEGRLQSEAISRMRFINDFYSEKYAQLAADFLCCRHTLEHIGPVREFLGIVRRSLGDRRDTVVFFEVPDTVRILRELAFWDIYYEHCSYFTLGSLSRLFRSCGFDLLDLTTGFDGQYLLIEARVADGPSSPVFEVEHDLEQVARDVRFFQEHYANKIAQWKADLQHIREVGRRPVLWGSGSKAIAYLTTLQVRDEIEFVVDINPFKHDMYLAGTGHKIVPPEFLKRYRPDVVIAMNPIYRDEIRRDLAALGIEADLVAV